MKSNPERRQPASDRWKWRWTSRLWHGGTAIGIAATWFVVHSAEEALEAPFTKMTTGSIATNLAPSIAPAWGDFDNDGWLDLFVGNQSSDRFPGTTNWLFLNNQDGTFTQFAVRPVTSDPAQSAHAAAWADYDNDGWLDLVVANLSSSSPNALYRNMGSGTFVRMTAADVGPLAADSANSVGVAWADYDRDGYLDLFVANGALVGGQRDFLYRNDRNGRFIRISGSPVTTPAQRSTQGTWSDYDNDGDLDLLVTHSGDQGNSLFRNDGTGRFVDVTSTSGLTNRADSVGAAWGDFDNDGDLDLFVTNLRLGGSNTRNLFYRNRGDGTFEQITTGVVAEDLGHFMSCAWVDYDNDGWLDLFLTVPSLADSSPTTVKNRLYHNRGDGTFAKVTQGDVVTDHGDTAGCAWGDYDNDGFLDLFVAFGAFTKWTNALYHNNGNANHWIKLKCVGTASNRSAIGTKIRAKVTIDGVERWQMRQLGSGEGWLSFNSPDLLIGLGDATVVEALRIEWPSGSVDELHDVPAGQTYTLVERPVLAIRHESGGVFDLTLRGERHRGFRLESSANLTDWTLVGPITITNLVGTASLKHAAAGPESQRFYRVVAEPSGPGDTSP